MSTEHDPRVERAAEAIAAGRPADLNTSPGDSGDVAKLFEGLRTVERVARVHRSILESASATASEADAPATAADPAVERVLFRWGGFDVLEPIGSGSFGEVWRARDPALARDVALKLRRADEPGEANASRQWLDEARRLARIRHANVVHVYGAAIQDGRAGIWMELVPGITLAQWLSAHGPMGWKEACLVGVELCAALAAVHGAGLVHNDVKLENVMRAGSRQGDAGGSGRIVLMDLGAGARAAPGAPGGATMGTPRATAPEVLLGGQTSVSSDLWSLGAALYRLVTGRAPFEADTVAGLIERARAGSIPPLRDVRPELPGVFVAAIERALARAPQDRFASAAEFERALARALDGSSPEPASTSRTARRAPILVVLGAGLAFAALVAVGRALWWQASPPAPSTQETPTLNGAMAPRARAEGDDASRAGALDDARSGAATSEIATAPVVTARFVRATAAGNEPLTDGDLVAPGDQLALEIETREPAWLYALNEDAAGGVNALFPVNGLDLSNPLPAGRYRLPGTRGGSTLDWQVTSARGHETFLFVASPRPLDDVERRVAAAATAHEGAQVETPGRAAPGSRGVTGLAPSRASGGGAGALESLERGLHRGGRLWVHRIELRNPGR